MYNSASQIISCVFIASFYFCNYPDYISTKSAKFSKYEFVEILCFYRAAFSQVFVSKLCLFTQVKGLSIQYLQNCEAKYLNKFPIFHFDVGINIMK